MGDSMRDTVRSLVGEGKLSESYNERARSGKAFQVNLKTVDQKHRATYQKAIDSGIMNNTNKAHEFVDMIAKISADKGVSFDFTNNQKLRESCFAIGNATVNGYVTKDGITINTNSQKALNSVVGHEITHVLEGTKLYTELQNAVKTYAETKGEYKARYDALAKLYSGVKDANIDAELTADMVGDYLFTDADFVNRLSSQNRNLFQKIYDEIKYLYKVATAGSKEARELEKVKRVFDKAYRESGNTQKNTAENSGVKYSISEQFYHEYDAWNKTDPRKVFTIGNTSDVLKKLGVNESEIKWDASKIIKIKSKHREMTDDIIKQVPSILENPIIVFKSLQSDSRMTLFGEVYADGKPILAVLELNPTDRKGVSLDEIKIASAYGKDNAQSFINRSEVLYVDNNKKRVSEWEKRTGLQLPVGSSVADSVYSLSQNDADVNTKFSLSDPDIAPINHGNFSLRR